MQKRIDTFSQTGVALLITLWLLLVLTITVASFSVMVKTEAYSTISLKENTENKYLAEAGIQRSIMEILYRNAHRPKSQGKGDETEELRTIQPDGTPYREQLGDGFFTFYVEDEMGKLDINALSDKTSVILRNLIIQLGHSQETADTVADSILDWKDADELHRINGAESNYYQSLPNPYKAKNANFDTLEELLLIKGITPALLYGNNKQKGLVSFLTVFGKTNKIQINLAPRELLAAIPDMRSDMIDDLMAARLAGHMDKMRELQNAIAGTQAPLMPYIGIGESNIYTIRAIGHKDDAKKGYIVTATIIVEGANKYRYLYYKSPGFL